MSGKAAVAAAPGVPASARRLVQSLKEIVNCPDAEIYATLRECDMDPDATVNRLLTQDTFHEVKSKRDKKKETKEPGESRPRAVNNTSARGSRVNSDRGSRSSYYQSSSNENQAPRVKATTVKESETNSQHTSSILGPATGGASNLNQKPTAPSLASNATIHTSNGLTDGPPLSSQPTPSGFQSAWSGGGLHGHLSMADVVKMGRPQASKSAAAPVAPVVSTDRSYAAQYPAMPSHAPKTVPSVPPEIIQSQAQPPLSQVAVTDPSPIATSTGNNTHDSSITDDWTIVDQPPVVAVDYSAGPGVSSLEGDVDEQHYGQVEASDEQVQVEDSGIDTELDDALNNAAAYQSQGHSYEHHEGIEEAEEDAAASAAGNFQQLNLHEEEQLMNNNSQEENPAVIIPNHLQVSNAECARLSFGSFTSGAFSGMFQPKTLEAHPEVASAVEEPSTVDQPDNRSEEFYNNGPLEQSPTENAGSRMGPRVETLDMPSVSASEPDVLRNEAPDTVHGLQYNVPSVSNHGFPSAAQPSGVEFGYSQGGTQLQNLSAFSSLLQANSLHGSLLPPPTAQPARDFDLSFSQLVTSQSMPTKYMQSVPSTSGSTISVQEAAKQQGVYSNQQPMAQTQTQNQNQTQNLASTNVPTGPPLPQPLAVHPYSQPTLPLGPFTNLIGYPFLPQSYTYLPSTAFQQPYTGNGAFHQSAAAVPNAGIKYTTVPQYKSSVSSSTSVPQQASSVVSGYGAFVGSGNVPGNFAVNPGSGSGASTSLGFDEALSSQYKDMSPYMSLQQSENPAMWLHGAAGSRTLSTMPASNFYSYQGQTQHGGFRQGQQPSQLNSLGYPNFYHSQIPGGAQDHHHHHQQHQHQHQHQHQQNPGDASLASGAQAATQQSSHQLWQNSY